MARTVDLVILLIFLLAVAVSSVQITQISLHPVKASVTVLRASKSFINNSQFLPIGDESDSTPISNPTQNTHAPIDAVPNSVTFPISAVVAVRAERSTVFIF